MKKKSLYQYIAPNILAMVGMSCYILADTFFIATSQGTNGITALNLALPIYGLIFCDWLHDWNWFCHSLYIGKSN